jgi:hypothetical protein
MQCKSLQNSNLQAYPEYRESHHFRPPQSRYNPSVARLAAIFTVCLRRKRSQVRLLSGPFSNIKPRNDFGRGGDSSFCLFGKWCRKMVPEAARSCSASHIRSMNTSSWRRGGREFQAVDVTSHSTPVARKTVEVASGADVFEVRPEQVSLEELFVKIKGEDSGR